MYMIYEGKHKNKIGESTASQKDFPVAENNFLTI